MGLIILSLIQIEWCWVWFSLGFTTFGACFLVFGLMEYGHVGDDSMRNERRGGWNDYPCTSQR